MRSTQVLAVLAVLATSVSSMSIGHVPNQQTHRRHAADVHGSVIQARGARRAVPVEDVSNMVTRDDATPHRRKRGINQRRCAPKTTTGLLETTPAVSTSSAAPTSSAVPTSSVVPTTSAAPSTTPEPEPTSSQAKSTASPKAKYTKTSSQKPTKTSTSAKPTATSDDGDNGSSSGDSYTGQATYYGTGLGACGITSKDTDYIAAVSQLLYDGFNGYTGSDPNSNPICGKKIKANYQGKSVTVTVVDRCVACAKYDLDFSPSAFSKIADQALGRLSDMTWSFQ
ncbi:hypothetical protein ACGC1H_001896 [Rhizoctonia solani]|uniref:RlpA-like protein double-psi beta-barrel domain-containing protein n=1 Tax=Rhizoctonia solani TaxID=456999 RepID=A0A8H2XCK6_9AGAM|nr:unnamed protein product [Rhizoctonia solani]